MTPPLDPTRCPLCGSPNRCRLASGATSNEQCWCASKEFPPELLVRVPPHARNRACICEDCWSAAVLAASAQASHSSSARDEPASRP